MIEPRFIHLRVHTEYSLVDGIVRIESLIDTAKKMRIPAVAVTDQCNLFATVKLYQQAQAEGIKPIIGVDVLLVNPQSNQSGSVANPVRPYRLTLFCQNNIGYQHVMRLVSRAYVEGQHQGIPFIKKEWLQDATEGVIALSGGREGDIGNALMLGNQELALQLLQQWLQLFPDRFYLELRRTGFSLEETYNQSALMLAMQNNVPVVATNDVRFLEQDDFDAHEARVCIHEGLILADPNRPRIYTNQQYFRSPEEMVALFSDIPESLENSVEIAKRCNVELPLNQIFLPNFPIPSDTTVAQFLCAQATQGLAERIAVLSRQWPEAELAAKKQVYEDRLTLELTVINSMGFAGYFLIVADFIQWAKSQDIPVGPGRGSGAGSLVAYSLMITDLDPLQYDLLFERFLNPERVSMPDFDIDFCMEGRDKVIDYVANRYGRESVSQIITYGTMAAKAVVRDVGRVLAHPYGFVDKLAKLIPFELGMTLEKALEQEQELRLRYEQEEEVKLLFDLALKLEGITRNAGKHAGGVVIAPSKLTDFSPLYCEEGSNHTVTQFDKDDVEAVGLVKFDFLGLRTLTIIHMAVQIINEKRKALNEEEIDISLIPMDDVATFDLLKACSTTAVFQLESRGMKDLVKRLQPDCFEEIIALVALFRPGPLQSGMVDDFIDRKHGRALAEYLHPTLEPILRPTYGIILYQEQVMQIAQVMGGYTLGAADLLRRAMGKKKPDEMTKLRIIFLSGASERGVNQAVANHIFDLMEKFAGYGFNKSHSAAYALVSYQTAWLKAHYPSQFMASVLSSDLANTDKVVLFIDECRNMKLTVRPPHINEGLYKFTVAENGDIIYGLGAIKGVGEAVIENIVNERELNGLFTDLFNFCKRIDLRKANRRALEAFVRSGALDGLGPHRAAIFATLEIALQTAEQAAHAKAVGQHDLFGEEMEERHTDNLPYVDVPAWVMSECLQGEKETLGHYVSGHPLQRFEEELNHLVTARLGDLNVTQSQSVIVAGIVVSVRQLFNKRNERMAFLALDDRTGRVEIAVFSDAFDKYKSLLVKDQLLVVEGDLNVDEYTGGYRLLTRKLLSLEQARLQHAKQLLLRLENKPVDESFFTTLSQLLSPYRQGMCPVTVEYKRDDVVAQIAMSSEWRLQLKDELLDKLYEFLGADAIRVVY